MDRATRRWITGSLALLMAGSLIAIGAITESSNDFHFSIMGDRTGGATPQIWGRVWREVDLLHPDFIINVGDSIEGTSDETVQAQWDELRVVYNRYRDYPLYFTPGNHDVWSDFSEQVYEKETGRPVSYGFDYQDAHFTVLDTSRTSELNKDQMQFLEEDLKQHQDQHPKFVFFHKPFWIVPLAMRNGDFPLHQMAKKYGVDYIVSGHGHQFMRMELDGITYLEVGSSGANLRGVFQRGEGFAQGRFYHHVWARAKGSQVSITVKEIDGPHGEGRMFRAEDWDTKGPKFDPEDPAISDKPET